QVALAEIRRVGWNHDPVLQAHLIERYGRLNVRKRTCAWVPWHARGAHCRPLGRTGPAQRAKRESLWQPRLAKQRQQPLVILISRESKYKSRYYTLDAEVGPLREAILHSCTRFLGPVQSRSRSRPNDRAIQMQSRKSHLLAFF